MQQEEKIKDLLRQYDEVDDFEQKLLSRSAVSSRDIVELQGKSTVFKDRYTVSLESHTLSPSKTNLVVSLEAASDVKGFILVSIAALIATLGTRIFFWLRAFIRKRRALKENGGDIDVLDFLEKAKKVVLDNSRGDTNLHRSFEPLIVGKIQTEFDGLKGSLNGLDEAYIGGDTIFKETIGYSKDYLDFLTKIDKLIKDSTHALKKLEAGNRTYLTKMLAESEKLTFGRDTLPVFRSKLSTINEKFQELRKNNYIKPVRVDHFLKETAPNKLLAIAYDNDKLDKQLTVLEKSLNEFQKREKLLAALSGDEATQRIIRNIDRKQLTDVRKDVRALLVNIQLVISSSRDIAMVVFNTTQIVQDNVLKIRRQITTHTVRAVSEFGKEHSKKHNMGVEMSMLVSTVSREIREGRGDV